jgi:hypothetical protein
MENNNCTMKKIVRRIDFMFLFFDKKCGTIFLKTENRSRYFGWWWDELKNKEEKKGKERGRRN